MVQIFQGDCIERMKGLADDSVDSIVTDPPYGISFMGRNWDHQVPGVEVWKEALRVLKPGGHLLAFAGTRTQHRMASAIEDAGFEIRDMLAWTYGSGFPKSLDVSKAIDKMDGSATQRENQLRFTAWMRSTGMTAARIDEITGTRMGSHYTTAAQQPEVATRDMFEMLRPHLGCEVPDWVEKLVDNRQAESENFKRRVKVGVAEGKDTTKVRIGMPGQDGALTRVYDITAAHTEEAKRWEGWGTALKPALEPITFARKPFKTPVAANVLEYGTGAINIDGCRVPAEKTTGWGGGGGGQNSWKENGMNKKGEPRPVEGRWPANLLHDGSDEATAPFGKASRFFYCAKASKRDRDEGLEGFRLQAAEGMKGRNDGSMGTVTMSRNVHPTVKPTELMRYLCRLVTPPGGVVLDPFMGSGSTGKAAVLEGFSFISMDLEAQYVDIAKARIDAAIASLYDFLA
jgi:ubiquinone/menaquinone biosynthesis C-methylase UbiE